MSKKNNNKNNGGKSHTNNPVNVKKPVDISVATEEIQGKPEEKKIDGKEIKINKTERKEEFNFFQRLLLKIGGIKLPVIPSGEPRDITDVESEVLTEEIKIPLEKFKDTINIKDSEINRLRQSLKSILLVIDPEDGEINEASSLVLYNKTNLSIENLRKALTDKQNNTQNEVAESLSSEEKISKLTLEKNRLEEELLYTQERFEEKEKRSIELKEKELKEKEELRKAKRELEDKVKVLQSDLDTKKRRIETIESEIGHHKKSNENSSAKLYELKEKYDQEKSELGLQLNDLQKKNDDHEAEIKRLRGKLNDLSLTEKKIFLDRLTTAKEVLEQQQIEIKRHISTISEKEQNIANLNKAIEDRDNKYLELDSEKKGLEGNIKNLEEEIKKTEGKVIEKEKEIKLNQQTIERQSKELEKNASEIEGLNKKVDNLRNSMNDKEEELSKANTEIAQNKKEIEDKENKISILNNTIKDKDKKLEESRAQLDTSNKIAAESVEGYREMVLKESDRLLKILNEGGYLTGAGEMGDSCLDDEERNNRMFGKLIESIKSMSAKDYPTVNEFRKGVIDILSEDIKKEASGCILPLARLLGYSRMPFMRDNQGVDYMILNKAKLSQIESYLINLLALAGINLIIPTPYCDRLNEGQYEVQTGSISNLDFICPNARQHLGKVDRIEDQDIITDIVTVGYQIPGESLQKSKVIV